jgi:hypothetical protein
MTVQTFPLGRVVITPHALGQLTPADIQLGLQRHQAGDWGDLGEEDWKENDQALRTGLRLLSSYRSAGGVTFWIITEADRSSSCLLLRKIINRQRKRRSFKGRLLILPVLASPHVSREIVRGHTLRVGFKGSSQNNNNNRKEKHECSH